MNYIGKVFRPPSEASSFIVQVTVGCAFNSCTFCSMYKEDKFTIRPMDEVMADLAFGSKIYPWKKVFLADGDALVIKTKNLIPILDYIYKNFPYVEQVSSYATVQDILNKSPEELKLLKEHGLKMLYVGMETGSAELLQAVKKTITPDEIIEALNKAKKAGLKTSVTLISGLGSHKFLGKHAIESAKVLSQAPPDYVAFLTLILEPGCPMYDDYVEGRFQLISPEESLYEIKLFLENADLPGTVFRSNHASNYLSLAGTLNKDRKKLIGDIDYVLKTKNFKPDYLRGL